MVDEMRPLNETTSFQSGGFYTPRKKKERRGEDEEGMDERVEETRTDPASFASGTGLTS